MAAATQQQRPQRRSSAAVPPTEFPPGSNYQLTELKNVAQSSQLGEEEFNAQLVDAIREHPCLFDSTHEHYGNRHSDAQYKASVWQQIASQINYDGDTHTLSQHWRKLKERYVRDRKKGNSGEEALGVAVVDQLHYLDHYLLDAATLAASAPPTERPSSSSNRSDPELFFLDGVGGEVETGGEMVEEDLLDEYDEEFVDETQVDNGRTRSDSVNSNGSDIDVGGVNTMAKEEQEGGMHSTGRETQQVRLAQNRMSSGPGPMQTYRILSGGQVSADGSTITVTARGQSGIVGTVRRDGMQQSSSSGGPPSSTLTMIIDPTTYYQNGSEKMYRLVNVADLDHDGRSHAQIRQGGRKRLATVHLEGGRMVAHRLEGPTPPPPPGGAMHTSSSASTSSGALIDAPSAYTKGQLGDDIILDDGLVGERTVVIDPGLEEETNSPLMVDSPGMHQMLIGGPGRSVMRGQMREHSPTLMVGNGRAFSPHGPHRQVIVQGVQAVPPYNTSQYDDDLNFQQFISGHLSRMNEDDKAIMKMNIQRILLDARFGNGTTSRMINEDEMSEVAVTADLAVDE